MLRHVSADLMRPESVECHTSHPESPKTDCMAGDVRGVLEVITPLDVPFEATRSGLVDTMVLMLFMTLGGVVLLGFAMRRS